MNLKRGILIGLALYFVTFIIGVLLTIVTRNSLSDPQSMPTTAWVITIVATVILTSLASIWYFSKGARRNAKEGFKLGLTFVLVGFILDLLFFIPLFIAGPGMQILVSYYTTASFYITLLLVIATATFIGSRGRTYHAEANAKPKASGKHKKRK